VKRPRGLVGFLALALSAGDPSRATEAGVLDPSRSTYPGYQTPAGWRSECAGRHLVDLPPGEIEWATLHDDASGRASYAGVDGGLWVEGESLVYGRVLIEVYPPMPKSFLERRKKVVEIDRRVEVQHVTKEIETVQYLLEMAQKRGDADHASSLNEDLRKLEAELAVPGPRVLDLGLPDSRGWVKDGIFRADLYRAGRLYHLALSPTPGQGEAATEAEFRDLVLRRFRVRQIFEVPREPGVCFPYGFIADDGRQPYDFQTTWRQKGVPGVLYTLRTGKNQLEATYAVEPYILAAALPGLGETVAGILGEQSVRRRIGPLATAIGPYAAHYAGVELQGGAPNPQPPGANTAKRVPAERERAYHLVSGLAGLPASDLVPYVYFELNGFGRGRVPSLKHNPPPLDSLLPTMHGILRSVRLKTLPANP